MFIGHYALGFGAKAALPRVSLGTLFIACQLADLLWPLLVLARVEHFSVAPGATVVTPLSFEYYPYSHSLASLAVLGIGLGLLHRHLARSDWRTAFLLTLLVASHWVLDVIAHRPDMPWAPGIPAYVGLGLWNSLGGTLVAEFGIFAVGVAIYARTTAPRDRTGAVALWTLVAFLAMTEVANIFGPPPPSTEAVTWSAIAMWLLVAWGYWIDRHRSPASRATAPRRTSS